MKHYEVIVIGMGLAGLMAAKAAVEKGKSVLIMGKGVGIAHTHTGCIDLLGYYPAGSSDPVHNPLQSLNRLMEGSPNHPYARVGEADIREALWSFLEVFNGGNYTYLSQGEENTITLTPCGSTRPTYLFPSTMQWGSIEDERDLLIVGFDGLKDFYGATIAQSLNSLREGGRISFKARSICLPLSGFSDRAVAAPPVLARLFEEDAFRDRVADAVSGQLKGEGRVAFPAVLGREKAHEVQRKLEARLRARVFEIPTLPPSVPGYRLFQAFKGYLQGRGVTVIMGFSTAEVVVRNGRCLQVTVLRPPIQRPYSADLYILATGRFAGGGLTVREDRVVEPILGLPVHQPFSREEWFKDRFFSDEPHPIEGFGVVVNEQLNPVDHYGNVVVNNLRVAGSILAGCYALREKSGGGVAIATGYKSGKGELD
jgi:glycerol-3-phosphate dehydrogenase subunit B